MAGRKPRLLDLFCGEGGAAVGYERAGFDVVGVDIASQPRYPFEFHQADAVDRFWTLLHESRPIDVIHASPPCQGYSAMNRGRPFEYPKLIEKVRDMLTATGLPFAIENVEGAPLYNALTLCGTAFGLRVRRHRLFELHPMQAALLPPCQCKNGVVEGRLIGHREGGRVAPGRTKPPVFSLAERKAAMGVEWMTAAGTREAIPPAYTEFIGGLLMNQLKAVA